MIQETKSNWDCVTKLIESEPELKLGRYASYWFYETPRRMLHSLSYYKFAAKMIGPKKSVVDIGCNEGLGTWVLAKECGFASGIDFDVEAIEVASTNFQAENINFSIQDILKEPVVKKYDAAVSFDVIEHIYPENSNQFFKAIKDRLTDEGVCIMGTPSLISQQFASVIAKKGHVNVYSPERFEKEMREHFEFVFMFAANDELVHTGYLPLAHYLIAVGCKKR